MLRSTVQYTTMKVTIIRWQSAADFFGMDSSDQNFVWYFEYYDNNPPAFIPVLSVKRRSKQGESKKQQLRYDATSIDDSYCPPRVIHAGKFDTFRTLLSFAPCS